MLSYLNDEQQEETRDDPTNESSFSSPIFLTFFICKD